MSQGRLEGSQGHFGRFYRVSGGFRNLRGGPEDPRDVSRYPKEFPGGIRGVPWASGAFQDVSGVSGGSSIRGALAAFRGF